MGRATPIAELAKSVVPVGNKAGIPAGDLTLHISLQDADHESWVMDIQGTAFQVGRGKLLTCWHVCETLRVAEREAYLYAKTRLKGELAQRPYPLAAQIEFHRSAD